ncbi:MAG: DsbA family protein [Rhodospirillales bacterium]|nr:DsbA family protein [Rhodospirillales bacterium]
MTEAGSRRTRFVGGVALLAILFAAGAAWFAFDPGFRAGRATPGVATDMPRDEFERRVRAYLLDNPEVIVEAVQRLQERQKTADADGAQAALKARADEVFRDPMSPVGGSSTGDVTLIEFFDYNCPYCRKVAPVMAEAEAADPRLRIVYKEFPILGPNSIFAAKAALAAHLQGRYVALHKALMAAKANVDEGAVLAAAAKVGLDVERLKVDMREAAIQDSIDRNLALAQALRINGTPGFVVGDRILRGATDLATLQGLIREARKKD